MKEQNKILPISKTLQECKNEVAKKHGYNNFREMEDNGFGIGTGELLSYVDEAAELYAFQFKSSLQPTIEEVKQDQIMYLNKGRLYKTPSDEPDELSITIISTMYLSALSELVAELHSLKMSINESPLKDFFPTKEMSFHDKCLFAIHALQPTIDQYETKLENTNLSNRESPETGNVFKRDNNREEVAKILRDNITFSGQVGDYVIHGAIDKIMEYFKKYSLYDESQRSESKRIKELEDRSETITLLEKYSLFLEKNGYLDTDWRTEAPFAIDEFLTTL